MTTTAFEEWLAGIDWTDLSDRPLHTLAAGQDPEGQWWGCEFPERPADGHANVDARCRGCALAGYAFAKALPDNEHVDVYGGDDPELVAQQGRAHAIAFARAALLHLHGIEVPE